MKRFLCVLMAMLFLLGGFTACSDNRQGDNTESTEETTNAKGEETTEATGQTDKKDVLILPYSAPDSLNPYKAKTSLNENISKLLYDGLFRLDESYSPEKALAGEQKAEGDYVTVTISPEAQFSGGSSVTASDVVHSFNTAKKSDYYKQLLENILSATAIDSDTVRFKLESPDPYALNCLTFPVIRYGDGDSDTPEGTGRYYYSNGKLKYNKNHISGEKAKIKTIELYDVKDNSRDSNTLQIGNISFMFTDLRDCKVERITAITRRVTLNNLVFLGINGSGKKLLSDSTLRKIIYHAIDKQDIAENSFQSYAVVADTPFNPQWAGLKDLQVKMQIYSPLELTQQLDKNGYTYASDTAAVRSKDGKSLKLKLLVNKNSDFKINAAEHIKTKLKAIGFDVVIEKVSAKELKKAVKKGSFDLYIGEVKLCENMSLSPFFSSGSASYGIRKSLGCIKTYRQMLSSSADMNQFVNDFNNDMPFIPICYRQGFVAVSNELTDNIEVNPNDVFENICQWSF